MSTEIQHKLMQVLKEYGYSSTHSRLAIFSLLLHPQPQSMNELIKRAGNTVDRVTIYRTIELFEKLNIVHRIYIGWKYKLELSDTFMPHHHHLTCIECGSMIDIEDEAHIDEFIESVASTHGFRAESHQFEISGYCKSCI